VEQWALDEIKSHITSSPNLYFADDSKAFHIEADSLDYAMDDVLFQQSLDDLKWHPITFYLKSLNAVKCNYNIHDKEMLVVMRSLEEWQHFLEGAKHKIKIWTDHKNLEYFITAKKLNHKQAQWFLYLSQFDFIMHHCSGTSMGKCDALLQMADYANGSNDNHNTTLLRSEFFMVHALKEMNRWSKRHLEEIKTILHLYTREQSKVKGSWIAASVQAAQAHGKKPGHARNL
jgi:hypothetical protein